MIGLIFSVKEMLLFCTTEMTAEKRVRVIFVMTLWRVL